MGGLSKKAFQIESFSQDYELPDLKIDGGSLLFKQEKLVPGMRDQAMITAKGIVQSYNAMGYDAVAVNRFDLAAGLDNLKLLQSNSTFPWISANLIDKSTKKTLFLPYTIATINKLRIAIIGLTAPSPDSTFPDSDRAEIIPWQQALPALIKEIAGQADMIILLSNYDEKNNKQIAKMLNEVNIIIQAGNGSKNREPLLVNNTLLCQTLKQGKYLGMLHLNWRQSKNWGDNTLLEQLALKKRELDGINSLYRRTEARISVNQRKDYATLLSLIKNRKIITEKIRLLQGSINQASLGGKIPASYKNRFIAMETSNPDQPDILEIVEETKKRVSEFNQRVAESPTNQKKTIFAGWKACAECHRVQTESWQNTSHSKAYQTLVAKKQQFNLSCLSCHVTIDMKDRDQVTGVQTRELLTLPEIRQQVGCEICHGSGKKHVKNPTENHMISRPASSICLSCHSLEHDDNFKYEIDIQKISCTVSH